MLHQLVKQAAHAVLPASRFWRKGPTEPKRLALTFDDGPCELTPAYLDVLDTLGVPATFFVVGNRVEQYPTLMREYVRRGHQVAAHGFDHYPFPTLSPLALHAQLRRCDAGLGPVPHRRLVRPPYGRLDAKSLAQLLLQGYTVAMWSFDSGDYVQSSADDLVARCGPAQLTSGDVMLFHEEQAWTLAALPAIVQRLKAEGYGFCTMEALFA